MKRKNKIVTTPTGQQELSLTDLTTRIKEREKQIDIACVTTVKHAMGAVQLAIDQGDDLALVRGMITGKNISKRASRGPNQNSKDANWTKWVAEHFQKGYETARRYMALSSGAKTYSGSIWENMKSLKEAYRCLGIMPESELDDRQLPSITVSPIISRLNFVAEWVTKSADDIASWEPLRREELKLQLKPVVELFQKL